MNEPMTIEFQVHFDQRARGRKELHQGKAPAPPCEPGREPRVAKLLALAHRLEGLLRDGVVKDYAELAALGQVSRARVTQIMNLLLLSPAIQEAILFLPRTERGRDPIRMLDLQPIALTPDWRKQAKLWQALTGQAADPLPG